MGDTPVPASSDHTDHTERTLDVRGVQTHLVEAGATDATPLLYLHG